MPDNERNVVEWLSAREPGFRELAEAERTAILHFALVWSYFEAKVCGKNANADRLVTAAQRWAQEGKLNDATFAAQLEYFRRRYASNGRPTHRFDLLRFPQGCVRQLAEDVMTEERTSSRDVASAMLLIVYRLRNNLFHGEKWQDGIAGQRENFEHAIAIMRRAIELNDVMPRPNGQ